MARFQEIPLNTNPEEFLIALEEAYDEYEGRHLEDGVPLGELIQAGYQVSIRGEEIPCSDDLKDESFQRRFHTIKGQDTEFDENDPPIESRGAYWCRPYKIEQKPQEVSQNAINQCLKVLEKIEKLSPAELARSHSRLGMSGYAYFVRNSQGAILKDKKDRKIKARANLPHVLRAFLQKSLELKLKGLVIEVKTWKEHQLEKAQNEHDTEAIQERATTAQNILNRVLIREDEPKDFEFTPVIEDQFTVADRAGQFDIEFEAHQREMNRIRRMENEDWYTRMWKPDKSKNMSGEEARWLMRNKIDREHRFDRAMSWIEEQTSPTALQRGIAQLNRKYRESRKECFAKKNWTQVRYTKAQISELKAALVRRKKEVSK